MSTIARGPGVSTAGEMSGGFLPYRDRSGNSGVRGYRAGTDFLDVEFVDGKRYRYTNAVPGKDEVRIMTELARTGQNLATFINRYVRERYAVRLPDAPHRRTGPELA